MAAVPQFRFGPRVEQRDNSGLNYVAILWRRLQVVIFQYPLAAKNS
jgi:hypothetical protein